MVAAEAADVAVASPHSAAPSSVLNMGIDRLLLLWIATLSPFLFFSDQKGIHYRMLLQSYSTSRNLPVFSSKR
jgi:hypothetical protein